MNKILNQAQASAVADAMCALNNVNAIALIQFGSDVSVSQIMQGAGVCVADRRTQELYKTQNDFVSAYGVAE